MYSNTSVSVPLPDTYDADRSTEPVSNSSTGTPDTSTSAENSTATATVSPET